MRTLLIAPHLPWPYERYGAAQRTELLRRCLDAFGPVDLMVASSVPGTRRSSDPAPVAVFSSDPAVFAGRWTGLPLPGPLGRLCSLLGRVKNQYARLPAAAEWLAGSVQQRRYDLVVVRYLGCACLVAADQVRTIPTILDFDDVDWLVFDSRRSIEPWSGWRGCCAAALVRHRLRRHCTRVARAFGAVWVTSQSDRVAVAPIQARVLPNIPFPFADDGQPVLSQPESRELLFVGLLAYPPNIHGLERFVKSVWPAVRRAVPEAALRVVGGGLEEGYRARLQTLPGVTVVGPAEDVRPEYARAAAAIAPVYQGGGTKIKVLESLALGRTCIVTPHALRGYEAVLKDRAMVWVGRTDDEFAEGCVRLLSSPRLREQMARAGHEAVGKLFSFASFQEVVNDTVNSLVAEAGPVPRHRQAPAKASPAPCPNR